MPKNFPKEWLKAALIRALRTAGEAALAYLTAVKFALGMPMDSVNWIGCASAAVAGAFYALVLALAGLPEATHDDGVLMIDVTDPQVDKYLLQANVDLEEFKNRSKVTFRVDANANLSDETDKDEE